jgi:pimeloyl-ACP methyl ester carboxylesterase
VADFPIWKYGRGEITLVLIHGGPSLSRYLQTLGDLLKDRYQIIEYQQRGTPEFPGDVSLELLLHDLKSVLSEAPSNRILVGHSWGATLINLYLQREKEKAIFISPAPLSDEDAGSFSKELNRRIPAALQKILSDLKKTPEDMQRRLEIISPYYHRDSETDKKLGELKWDSLSFNILMDEVWDKINKGELLPRPEVFTISGEADPIPRLPWAITIPEAGHFPWLEGTDFAQSFAGAVKMLRGSGTRTGP